MKLHLIVALLAVVLVLGCTGQPTQPSGQANETQQPPANMTQPDQTEPRQEADVGPEPTALATGGCIALLQLHYDAADQIDSFDLNDEYVVLKSTCSSALDMHGYRLTEEGQTYLFQDFVLQPGSSVTIYSGKGTDSTTKLYWRSGVEIWQNAGDTLTLIDNKSFEFLSYSYGS